MSNYVDTTGLTADEARVAQYWADNPEAMNTATVWAAINSANDVATGNTTPEQAQAAYLALNDSEKAIVATVATPGSAVAAVVAASGGSIAPSNPSNSNQKKGLIIGAVALGLVALFVILSKQPKKTMART